MRGKTPFTGPTFYQKIRKIFKALVCPGKQLFLLRLINIGPFKAVGSLWDVSKVEGSANPRALPFEVYPVGNLQLAFRGLSCWEASPRLPRSPSEVYPAGKVHLAFRGLSCWEASLRFRLPRFMLLGSFTSPPLPGFILLGGLTSPSGVCPAGGLHLTFRGLSCWETSPCLRRFILLEIFSGTLLVVSILDMVYDCHL